MDTKLQRIRRTEALFIIFNVSSTKSEQRELSIQSSMVVFLSGTAFKVYLSLVYQKNFADVIRNTEDFSNFALCEHGNGCLEIES